MRELLGTSAFILSFFLFAIPSGAVQQTRDITNEIQDSFVDMDVREVDMCSGNVSDMVIHSPDVKTLDVTMEYRRMQAGAQDFGIDSERDVIGFVVTAEGNSYDQVNGLQTSDGGYLLAGTTDIFGAGADDVILLKFDVLGRLLWAKTVGGTENDSAHSVQETSDGSYILTGYTESYGAGMADVLLLKINSSGDLIWVKTAGGAYYDMALSVQETADGGYIAAGTDMTTTGRQMILLKFDSSGTLEWNVSAGELGMDPQTIAQSVQQTADGGYIVTGSTNAFAAGYLYTDILLCKFDTSGTLVWTRTLGTAGDDAGYTVKSTSDGGYILTGHISSGGQSDAVILKFDSADTLEWGRQVGGSGWSIGQDIREESDGSYIMAGEADSYCSLVKCDASGTLLWARTTIGSSGESAYSAMGTSDGGYMLAGKSGNSFLIIKTGPEGYVPDCSYVEEYSPTDIPASLPDDSQTVSTSIPLYTTSSPYPVVSTVSPDTQPICNEYFYAGWTFMTTTGLVFEEEGRWVQTTIDGGYIVVGSTDSFSPALDDVFLLKYDYSGVLLWARTAGGTSKEKAYSAQITSDGGYIVVGETNSYGVGVRDCFILKYDSAGTLTWARSIGTVYDDLANSVQQTSDGGYIVVGMTVTPTTGSEVLVMKLTSSGVLTWAASAGGAPFPDEANSVYETSDGGFIVAGKTFSYGEGLYDVYLLKYNDLGSLLWSSTVGASQSETAQQIRETSDGGFILVGSTMSFGAGNEDVLLQKYDAAATLMWTKTTGGSGNDSGHAVHETSDGGFILTGKTASYGAGNEDVFLVKYDSSGGLIWARTAGGSNDDYAYAVQETSDNGYVLVGRTDSYGVANGDIFMIKTDSDGLVSDCAGIQDCSPALAAQTCTVGSPGTNTGVPGLIMNSPSATTNTVSPIFDDICLNTPLPPTPTPGPVPATGPVGQGILLIVLGGLLSIGALKRRNRSL